MFNPLLHFPVHKALFSLLNSARIRRLLVRCILIRQKEVKLDPGNELCIQIGTGEVAQLELKSGYADIFGSELKMKTPYVFKNITKVSVFTHEGCRLILQIADDRISINKETAMMSYLKYHKYLEQLRQRAEQNNSKGPITVVVGPKNVGKSTLCRILLNYAVQMKNLPRTPIFVDSDVGQNHVSIPGTIGAMIVTQPASVHEMNFTQDSFPVTYHFGHVNLRENPKLFDRIISRLAEKIHQQMDSDLRTKFSGVVINTVGWIRNRGYLHILHIVREFQADNVIVLDDEMLTNKLMRSLPLSITVTRLPKNTDIETINSTARVEIRKNRVREYFYNSISRPHSFEINFFDAKIYRIKVPAPEMCAPFSLELGNYPLNAIFVRPNENILYHVLAVSNGHTLNDVIDTTVADFVCVTKIDAGNGKLVVLSLQNQNYLTDKYLLLSDVKMSDN